MRDRVPPEWTKPPTPEIFSAATLMAADLPPVEWVVNGLLPEGVTLLVGKPKLGKSWLGFGLGVAVAAGGVALGKKPVEQGSVLYLALEDNKRRLQKRLGKLLLGEAPGELHMATEWSRLDEGGLAALRTWLSEHPDARLVVVDTLAKIRPRQKGQNVYAEDYGALEGLLPLAAEFGVAIVVVHHTRKMAAADPLDEISGSTGLSAGVDGALVLKRDRGKADAVLHVDGRDIEEPAELALKWDSETAGWTLVGDAEEYRMSEERKAIFTVLGESMEPMTPADVADALGKNRNTLKQRLWRMAQDGQLVNEGGRYKITHNHDNRITGRTGNGYGEGAQSITGSLKESGEDKPISANGYEVTPVIGYSEGEGDGQQVTCIHGFPEGKGCYLCDRNHPYRFGEGDDT